MGAKITVPPSTTAGCALTLHPEMNKNVLMVSAGLLVVFAGCLVIWPPGSEGADESGQSTLSSKSGSRSQNANSRKTTRASKTEHRPGDGPKRLDGKKHGIETELFPNGNKAWVRRYQDGRPEGTWTNFYESGQRMQEMYFENGRQEGVMTKWHENGQKWIESEFKYGRLHGTMKVWDKDGNLIRTSRYWAGKPASKPGSGEEAE